MLAGFASCITAVPELLQTPGSSATQSHTSTHLPEQKQTWQMLTGHASGHMKLWQATDQDPLQALAVIRAARNSPVQSLVMLTKLNLICSAHSDGHISLFVTPEHSAHLWLPSFQIDNHLPALNLPSASFEAHKSGLRQCMAGDTGLVSLGAFGSIMVWPEAELKAVVSSGGLPVISRCDKMSSYSSVMWLTLKAV